jgi:hypothetical protein
MGPVEAWKVEHIVTEDGRGTDTVKAAMDSGCAGSEERARPGQVEHIGLETET